MKKEKGCTCAEYYCTVPVAAKGIADMHSHILPGMDDGAKNAEESLSMLSLAYSQGIRTMVASSHFYADRETPEEFLQRRAGAVRRLIDGGYSPEKGYPNLYLGAEVAFFSGMARSPMLPELCIGGGKGILIEMPFERWTEGVINEVLAIREARGLRPIIAHIERYIGYQKRGTLGKLIEGGVLIQSNAEYFIEKKTAKKALKLLLQGGIHLLGSDAHGFTERVPNLGEGICIIDGHKYGEQLLIDIVECSRYVLKAAAPVEVGTVTA
jgi:protein-tyrosine phosphatase